MIKIKTDKFFLYSVILLMLILPLISILIDFEYFRHNNSLISLIGKWFIFWAVGLRQFTAGLRQIFKPRFTAETIFHITDKESHVIVRELGFANICFGLTAIISFYVPQWRIVVAFSSGLFFGIAGINHIIRKPSNPNELIPTISDIFVFVVMVLFLVINSITN